jgi:hypothetical protein
MCISCLINVWITGTNVWITGTIVWIAEWSFGLLDDRFDYWMIIWITGTNVWITGWLFGLLGRTFGLLGRTFRLLDYRLNYWMNVWKFRDERLDFWMIVWLTGMNVSNTGMNILVRPHRTRCRKEKFAFCSSSRTAIYWMFILCIRRRRRCSF